MGTPLILSIAGSDSIGGAGIQADLRTAQDLGVHCTTAITAVTAQNRDAVQGVYPVPVDGLIAQIDAVLEDVPIAAVKIGMLCSAAHAAAVAERLAQVEAPIVLDPVLAATTGATLLDDPKGLEAILATCALVTPNHREASILSGGDVESWLDTVGVPVLLTGGDVAGEHIEDILFRPDHAPRMWKIRRRTGTFHGTGCTLSTAIACGLAHGFSLSDAIDRAIGYVQHLIRHSDGSELLPFGAP